MSKSQALGWAIVAGTTAVCCWLIPGLAFIGTASLIVCLGFLLWYGYKRWKHARLLGEAWAETHQEQPKLIATTTPGSSRLFVPQPLDK